MYFIRVDKLLTYDDVLLSLLMMKSLVQFLVYIYIISIAFYCIL